MHDVYIIHLNFEHQPFSIQYSPLCSSNVSKIYTSICLTIQVKQTLSGGNGIELCEAYGSVITFMQVLASGKKDFVTLQNLIFGANLKPSYGSSSVEVANCKIDSNFIFTTSTSYFIKERKIVAAEPQLSSTLFLTFSSFHVPPNFAQCLLYIITFRPILPVCCRVDCSNFLGLSPLSATLISIQGSFFHEGGGHFLDHMAIINENSEWISYI